MNLVLFDDGSGPRIGVVRRNHVVDGRAAGVDKQSLAEMDPDDLARLAGLDESCPQRNAIRRLSAVRVLARWAAPA